MPDRDDHRIAKLLARAGVASRREVERMIADGRVSVNGAVLDTPATVLPSLAGVTVDGAAVNAPEPARLFLYHKPPGLLVTERDPAGRPTIYDRLPATLPRVVPVGRLDLATEGLLLLTTDGGLKRQLELPATGVERAYRARAYGPVTQARLEELIEGVEIEGVRYGSINANLERRTGANVWIELILTEGKNREVRRVLEHLGLRVSRLIRTRYGPFVLGDLPPGEVGEVRQHDVASFRKHPTRLDLPQPARARGSARPAAMSGEATRTVSRVASAQSSHPQRNAPARVRPVDAAPVPPRAGFRPKPIAREPEATARRPEARAGLPDRARAPTSRTFRGKPETARPHRGPDTAGEVKSRTSASQPSRVRGERTARPDVEAGAPAAAKTRVKHFRAAPTGAPASSRAEPRAATSPVANPARAARAQAHRGATGRPDPAPAPKAGPKPGPKFGRGAPSRSAPPRPPRTRK